MTEVSKEVFFADRVYVDASAVVWGALTDDDIISEARDAKPVAGDYKKNDEARVRLSAQKPWPE